MATNLNIANPSWAGRLNSEVQYCTNAACNIAPFAILHLAFAILHPCTSRRCTSRSRCIYSPCNIAPLFCILPVWRSAHLFPPRHTSKYPVLQWLKMAPTAYFACVRVRCWLLLLLQLHAHIICGDDAVSTAPPMPTFRWVSGGVQPIISSDLMAQFAPQVQHNTFVVN